MTIDSQIRSFVSDRLDASRPRLDLADYDTPIYPLRIRDAAAEVRARREVMADYIKHTKENGHCDYESLHELVADASDAECALLNLIDAWQSAALAEDSSLLQWLDQAAGERDYEER